MYRDKDKYNAWMRQYNKTDKARSSRTAWNQSEHGKRKKWIWHLNRYGITPDDYNAKLASQGGRCAICRVEDHGGRGWNIDHNHATGKFRGILCLKCNLGLGYFRDNELFMQEAIKYLKDNK